MYTKYVLMSIIFYSHVILSLQVFNYFLTNFATYLKETRVAAAEAVRGRHVDLSAEER